MGAGKLKVEHRRRDRSTAEGLACSKQYYSTNSRRSSASSMRAQSDMAPLERARACAAWISSISASSSGVLAGRQGDSSGGGSTGDEKSSRPTTKSSSFTSQTRCRQVSCSCSRSRLPSFKSPGGIGARVGVGSFSAHVLAGCSSAPPTLDQPEPEDEHVTWTKAEHEHEQLPDENTCGAEDLLLDDRGIDTAAATPSVVSGGETVECEGRTGLPSAASRMWKRTLAARAAFSAAAMIRSTLSLLDRPLMKARISSNSKSSCMITSRCACIMASATNKLKPLVRPTLDAEATELFGMCPGHPAGCFGGVAGRDVDRC